MKHVLNLAFIVVFGVVLYSSDTEAGHQSVNIRLGGKYCSFYEVDLAKELRQIPGVTDVDFQTMRGHVYVTVVAGKVNPNSLLAAIRRVKGDGYYCTGQFEGEPARVERY